VTDCFLLTPIETGLPSSGVGASESHIALRPASPTRGELLLFFNGSGGSPRTAIDDPAHNYYTVARDLGLHVLAVSYRSDEAIGRLCAPGSPTRDACFEPTRRAVITGEPQAGAAAELADIEVHEGIYGRVAAALRTLSLADPAGGWDAFVDESVSDPGASIAWADVIVSGHSQGGGHAALLGKLHAVSRVVMLASPCDGSAGSPATWLTRTAELQTDASRFFALGAMGDTICGAQYAAWPALGMSDAAGDDTAIVCAGAETHGAPIRCLENEPTWSAMLR
jgi:hypothetical protein